MRTITLFKHCIVFSLMLNCAVLFSQKQAIESFDVSEDVLVSVNTSHTNVVFETWNKNKVEVVALVDGENLSEKEKEEILQNWDYDVLGNSKKVVVTSNAGNHWPGMAGLAGLEGLSGLKELYNMPILKDFNFNMPKLNFNFSVPDVPKFDDFPQWPFSDEQPSIKYKDGYKNYHVSKNGEINFNSDEYKKDKKAYVAKLNKKYNANASVADVDRWLSEVDRWSENVEKVMEEWGENFGKEFGEKFGSDFEMKMEKWGEEFGEKFGKDMEKWGEEYGKKMEEWGKEFEEKFGKDMEQWGEEYGKQMEKWAEEFEKNGGNFNHQVITTPHGDKTIIIKGDKHGEYKNVKATKTLIIRMPKGAKTEINVKYGEIKMADAYNIKATLNYSPFTANSIDGGKTLINAAYAPVKVNNWNDGTLFLKYIDDCKINTVGRIDMKSNSSNIDINVVNSVALLSGSFGDVKIKKVSDSFKTIELNLDNTDAFIAIPNSSFTFNFNGKRSTLLYPKSLQLDQTKDNGRVLVNGFNKSRNSGNIFSITASYSNIKLQ